MDLSVGSSLSPTRTVSAGTVFGKAPRLGLGKGRKPVPYVKTEAPASPSSSLSGRSVSLQHVKGYIVNLFKAPADVADIFRAVEGGKIDEVRSLCTSPAVANSKNRFGETPLFVAAHKGYLDIVRMLVEDFRVDIDASDSFGCTALNRALTHKHLEVAFYLLRRGASNVGTRLALSPNNGLLLAIDKRHIDFFEFYLKEDANPLADVDGRCAWESALYSRRSQFVDPLISKVSLAQALTRSQGYIIEDYTWYLLKCSPQSLKLLVKQLEELLPDADRGTVNQRLASEAPLTRGERYEIGQLAVRHIANRARSLGLKSSDPSETTPLTIKPVRDLAGLRSVFTELKKWNAQAEQFLSTPLSDVRSVISMTEAEWDDLLELISTGGYVGNDSDSEEELRAKALELSLYHLYEIYGTNDDLPEHWILSVIEAVHDQKGITSNIVTTFQERAKFAGLWNKQYDLLVARDDGGNLQGIGLAGAVTDESDSLRIELLATAHWNRDPAIILPTGVPRVRGCGSSLVEAFVKRGLQANKVTAITVFSTQHASEFYEKLGFEGDDQEYRLDLASDVPYFLANFAGRARILLS